MALPLGQVSGDASGASRLGPAVILVAQQDLACAQRGKRRDAHALGVRAGQRHGRQDRRTRARTHEGASGLVGRVEVGCPSRVRERLRDTAHDVVAAGTGG